MKKLTTDEMLEVSYLCGQLYELSFHGDGEERALTKALGSAASHIHHSLRSMRRGNKAGKAGVLSGLASLRAAIEAAPVQLARGGTLGSAMSEVHRLEEALGAGHVGRTLRAHDLLAEHRGNVVDACFAVAKAEYEASRITRTA